MPTVYATGGRAALGVANDQLHLLESLSDQGDARASLWVIDQTTVDQRVELLGNKFALLRRELGLKAQGIDGQRFMQRGCQPIVVDNLREFAGEHITEHHRYGVDVHPPMHREVAWIARGPAPWFRPPLRSCPAAGHPFFATDAKINQRGPGGSDGLIRRWRCPKDNVLRLDVQMDKALAMHVL